MAAGGAKGAFRQGFTAGQRLSSILAGRTGAGAALSHTAQAQAHSRKVLLFRSIFKGMSSDETEAGAN